jgi:hypothetical protein
MDSIKVGDSVVCNSAFDSDASPVNAESKLRGVVGVVVGLTKHDAQVKYPDGVWPCIPSLPIDTLTVVG